MDDVQIIDVNEDGEEVPVVHKSSLENQDMGFFAQAAEDILGQYGWYLVVLTVCLILLIQYLSKRRNSQGNKDSSNETPQASLIVRRQEALEASRRRLQEDLDAKAAEFREKQKKAEEAGPSSAVLKPKSDKKLRGSDYNPLTGDGGASCSWRPGRRGPSSGG